MNDASLEQLLQSLHPVSPTAELTSRVEQEMKLAEMFRDAPPVKPTRSSWSIPVMWAALGAAAAVLVMSVLPPAGDSGAVAAKTKNPMNAVAANTSILPVSSSREWLDVEDGGISYATPDAPQRQVRVRSLQRQQWIDPRDGAEYTVETPVVDSVVLPVKFQ